MGKRDDRPTQIRTFPGRHEPSEFDLRPPPVRSGFILRRELLKALTTTEGDVITVVAPPGYGKTTALAQWARVETDPLAWLSLRREDNSPKILLSHLAASIRRAGILTAEDVALFQFMGESAAASDGARHFARLLETTTRPVLMVIDNLDVLRSRGAIDVVAELVRQLEGKARLALASHSTPKIGVPEIRADGRLLEITEENLAFSVEEGEQLVTEMGIAASSAADIVEATEGWPVATFLMAIAARDASPEVARRKIEGQPHLHEFVTSEIVPRLSKRRHRFLSLMSLLERMSGALGDAISGANDSQRLLDSIERDTHLIHHLDHDNTWFEMNRVLREALRAELDHREPETARSVHSSAAAWFGENDLPIEAIGHALEAGDAEVLAKLMERLMKSHYATGHVVDVLGWMKWLEENASLDDYPGLAAIGALVHVQEGNVLGAERWLDAASRGKADSDAKAVIQLVLALAARGGVEQTAEDIELAVEVAGPGSRWLPAILVVRGLAHTVTGDIHRAEPCYIEAAKIGLEIQSLASVILALGQRALIAIGRQEWDLANSLSDQALRIIDEHGLDGYHTSGLPLVAAARCARHSNDILQAQRFLARAASVRPRLSIAMPGASVQILLEMAKAHVELSDVAGARPLIREAELIIQQRPDLGVLPAEVEAVKESLASFGSGRVGLPALTKAELRLLPFLATHLSFPEIGEELFVSRHTVKSQATSIYRKLGGSTRSEAIARAYEIGLLIRK